MIPIMKRYTRAETAELMGVTIRTVDNYLRNGVLTPVAPTRAQRAAGVTVAVGHRDLMEVKHARERLLIKAQGPESRVTSQS